MLKKLDNLDTGCSVKATAPQSSTWLATQVNSKLGDPAAPLYDPHDCDFVRPNRIKNEYLHWAEDRFFGKSSQAILVQKAIDLKHQHTGQKAVAQAILDERCPEFWIAQPVHNHNVLCIHTYHVHQWEEVLSWVKVLSYTSPDDNLLHTLIDIYFDEVNVFLPLLHWPTFKKYVTAVQHLENSGFRQVLLLVCAVGSRYSEDPHVLLDNVSSYHLAGWKWFDQVQIVKTSFWILPMLYDLQCYWVSVCGLYIQHMYVYNWVQLAVQYVQGCSASQQCWTMIGISIQIMKDVGAHQRKYKTGNMTVEDEMWKHAFWYVLFHYLAVDISVMPSQGPVLPGSFDQLFSWTSLCYSGRRVCNHYCP